MVIELLEEGMRKIAKDEIYKEILEKKLKPAEKYKMEEMKDQFERDYIRITDRMKIDKTIETEVLEKCKQEIGRMDLKACVRCLDENLVRIKDKIIYEIVGRT